MLSAVKCLNHLLKILLNFKHMNDFESFPKNLKIEKPLELTNNFQSLEFI